MKKNAARFAAAVSAAAIIASLAGCAPTGTAGSTPTPTDAAIEYIAAPHAAGGGAPTEYAPPAFYENEGGPTISVTYVGVICRDGKYFRDSDNDRELDPFEDWRLPTGERVADLMGKLTVDQRIGLLQNALMASPGVISAGDVYRENGSVDISALVDLETDGKEEGGAFHEGLWESVRRVCFATHNITDGQIRAGVIRKDTDTETGALFNNTLNLFSEWDAVSRGEAAIPFMLISSRVLTGYPLAVGFGAAVAGDGDYDCVRRFAEVGVQLWDAKGIHQMYGPQIDLITDPRWSRNYTTYTEIPEDMAGIARAMVEGYQGGADGVQPGDVALIMLHFPGDGAAENGFESHYGMGQWRIYSTPGSLEKYQLVGFQAAIDAGIAGVMPGYSRPTADGRSAPQSYRGVEIEPVEIGNAYSPEILQKLLRDTMGFQGFVNTDSGVITGGMQYGAEDMTPAQRFAAVVNAGSDVVGDAFVTIVDSTAAVQAVEEGLIDPEAFDRATASRLQVWIDLGMFENPYRDPDQSRKVGEDKAAQVAALQEEINRKSVVLMKNHGGALPLTDPSKRVYLASYTEKGPNRAALESWAAAVQAAGFTLVDRAEDADVVILDVVPYTFATGNEYLHTLELAEDVEVDHVDPATQEPDGETVEITTLQDVGQIARDAAAVHANGGTVIASINITSPWILSDLEPHVDVLLGSFGTSVQARMDVITGAYRPTGRLPVTMVACGEVIAVDENGRCASPNDVPGYDKDQYMDPAVLAQSPSGSYAYQDADGSVYRAGFGLSIDGGR